MTEEIKLTWIRFNLRELNVFDDVKKISFEDSSGMTVNPKFLRTIVDGYRVDVIGSMNRTFKYINIAFKTGANKKYFCDMFVSGGRNVALKQPVGLIDVYRDHVAERAVDGVRDANLDNNHCASTPANDYNWLWLIFRIPIYLNYIEIYNSDFLQCRLKSFRLTIRAKNNTISHAQDHYDNIPEPQMVYQVLATTFDPVFAITLSVEKHKDGWRLCDQYKYHYNVLTVCELEAYGEVICPERRYGYDCEKTCDSDCVSGCQVETGFCNKCRGRRSGKYCETIDKTESWTSSIYNGRLAGKVCEHGVFGLNCTNKCHCRRGGDCTDLGFCRPFRCEDGWCGLRCSYRDVAFNKASPLTDNSFKTCLDSSTNLVYNFTMTEETMLTWIRFNFKKLNPIDVFDDVKISFEDSSGMTVNPNFLRKIGLRQIVFLIGSMNRTFKYINIAFKTGANKKYFCDMFVSGGRNVAFKQPVALKSVYQDHVAERAVDGVRDNNRCASTLAKDLTWLWLRFRIPPYFNYIEIYKDFQQCRLKSIRLAIMAIDRSVSLVEVHYDNISEPQTVDQVLATSFDPVYWIYLSVDKENWGDDGWRLCDKDKYHDNVLNVCELEVYGEVMCPEGRYGYDCEKNCEGSCVSGCQVDTGFCNKCAAGRSGRYCDIFDTTAK